MGAQRSSHDLLRRSEDSMLIPRKESHERTLHRDNRSVNLDNLHNSSEKKLNFNEQSLIQRSSFEENQYRKKKLEDEEDVPTREDFESQTKSRDQTVERSPILRYITNNSSPDQHQRSVIKLQAVDNEDLEEIEKEKERQRQEVERFHKQQGVEGEGEEEGENGDDEDYGGELLRGRGNLIDISTEMRSVNLSGDYASQAKLQEQINRSAAKIMQLLNIKPSNENQDEHGNGKKGATMFGREPNNVTAKFAATDFVEASRDEEEQHRGSLSRSRSASPDRVQDNYGNVTLGDKMRMALKEGKENVSEEVKGGLFISLIKFFSTEEKHWIATRVAILVI